MFENLSDKLQDAFRNLAGKGKLSEKNIEDVMRQIRLALLDADVNYKVVKEYIAEVREECLGEKVLKGVNPGQMATKVVHDHLTELMGAANVPLELPEEGLAVLMLVGLHGSGKTTTSAKLALHLKQQGKNPLLVAGDLRRPAAIDQLEVLGRQIAVPVFADRSGGNSAEVANAARAHARHEGFDTMIFDTAGRHQLAEDLVQELVLAKRILNPSEILLVADAALGQEAVAVATGFDEALGLSGIILTKLDGDARGGAALSMRRVTGKPVKFVGVGEKLEDLQAFHPDRMADRILGMGDVVSLVENIQGKIDEDEAKKLEQKMLKSKFDFSDFQAQLRQLRRLGGMQSLLSYLPGGASLLQKFDLDEGVLKHVEAVIQSMTPYERQHPVLLNNFSRRQRIARGAGRPLIEVQQLLKRFETMRGMLSQYGKMAKKMGGIGVPALPDFSGGSSDDRSVRDSAAKSMGQKTKKARRKRHRQKRRNKR